jgi:DNA polymerase IV
MRKIIHVDMDAFYASVEQRDRPELRGLPVVVAWSKEARGVVVAASYEARKFGIRSAMPAVRAARQCPQAIFIRPDFEKYVAVSRRIREIFLRYTPLVEPLSLDEAYLDVTEPLVSGLTATEIAKAIRRSIREELDLTASAGVAPNKFLAKIASDWNKPDGLCVIKPHQVERFLTPLPVGKIPGVGRATEAVLHDRGIETVGQLRERSREDLVDLFGSFGERLWELARGIDEHPVVASRERKSYSCENTFAADQTLDEVVGELRTMAAELWEAASKKHCIGRTVTVKLRAADFTTATRRMTLAEPLQSAEELAEVALVLLGRFSFQPRTRYRLVGIGMSSFDHDEAAQRSLF